MPPERGHRRRRSRRRSAAAGRRRPRASRAASSRPCRGCAGCAARARARRRAPRPPSTVPSLLALSTTMISCAQPLPLRASPSSARERGRDRPRPRCTRARRPRAPGRAIGGSLCTGWSSRLPAWAMSAAACRICDGPARAPFHAGRGRGRERRPTSRPAITGRASTATCSRAPTAAPCSSRACPSGAELHDLYRDDARRRVPREEAGPARDRAAAARPDRRATSPAGRLLDVGCGHGLLLDEARRRGYEVSGLELSRAAAGYARDVLGLEVDEAAGRGVRRRGRPTRYDVIVLADVIEHLDDPAAALRRLRGAAGRRRRAVRGHAGPASAPLPGWPARAGGATCPAHTCLLPRRTLRELLTRARARHLRRRPARALVRAALLARRALRARRARRRRRCAGSRRTRARAAARVSLVARATSASCSRTASRSCAGASRWRPTAAADPRHRRAARLPRRRARSRRGARDAGATPSTARCWSTTPARTRRRRSRCARASTCCACPPTAATAATRRPCYVRALLDGADIVVMVHADNQYDPALVERMVRPIEAGIADVVIGLAAARGRGDRRRDAALEVGRQPRAHRGREPRLPARLLRVPHGLPRVLGRLPAPRRVPAQLRRLRVRPGDLRPDRGQPQPRGRAADPDALLPRGVERLVPRLGALRPQDALGARPLPAAPARPPLAGARAPCGRRWPRRPGATPRRPGERLEPAARSLGGIVARNTLAQAAGKVVVLAVGAVSIAVTTRYLGADGLRPLRARAGAAADARRAGRRRARHGRRAREQPGAGADGRAGRQRAGDAARARRRRSWRWPRRRAGCRPTGRTCATPC